jgi:GntR family transcriptional repressor for pyruvate dehydrogenase complex
MSDKVFRKLEERKLLSKTVEEEIEQAIRERKLKTGEKLPTEVALSQTFGVSRTVMREALRMLSARGLLTIEKGKGIHVRDFGVAEVMGPLRLYLALNVEEEPALHLIRARQMIEPSIARLAAERRTEVDLVKLRENIAQLASAEVLDSSVASLDMEFHLLLARATGNPILPLLLEPIHHLMPQVKSSVYATVDDARQSAVVHHGKVLDAVERRDGLAARDRMEAHLQIAEQHIRAMLHARGSTVTTS